MKLRNNSDGLMEWCESNGFEIIQINDFHSSAYSPESILLHTSTHSWATSTRAQLTGITVWTVGCDNLPRLPLL